MLFVSNVDNLAATLDPAIIGAHLRQGRAVTVEVVRNEPGDVGGAPARVDGVLQIVEAFRFPPNYPQGQLPVFNTNTFVMDAAAVDRDFDLTFFRVTKKVEDEEVIQFERLVGQVTAFVPTGLVVVPRHAPLGRFEPIRSGRPGQAAGVDSSESGGSRRLAVVDVMNDRASAPSGGPITPAPSTTLGPPPFAVPPRPPGLVQRRGHRLPRQPRPPVLPAGVRGGGPRDCSWQTHQVLSRQLDSRGLPTS